MGGRRIWLIVEGIGHDVYFYERVLDASDRIVAAGHDVRDASSIKFEGSTAGGKQRLLAMHDFYKKRGELRQIVDGEEKLLFFALDRDLDGITGNMRRSPHLLYTDYRDVEAEIFARGDMEEALAATLGLTHNEAWEAAQHVGEPLTKLASVWLEWTIICCIVTSLRIGVGISSGKISTVNAGGYGAVVDAKVAHISQRMAGDPRFSDRKRRWIEDRVRSRERRGLLGREVKGKLVVGYVELLIKDHFQEKRKVALNAIRPSLVNSLLMSVRFERPWVEHWTVRIERLLS
ncbi:hypothetical protein GCM10010413_24450 [Promicromonospora sukumoe]